MMSMFRYLFIFSCVFSVFVHCFSMSQNGIGFRDSKYDNLYLSEDFLIIEYYGVTATIDCALFCAEKLHCMSFTFNREKRICRLHRTAAISLSQGLKSDGWMYFVYGEKQCPIYIGFIHDRENDFCIKISEQQLKANEGDYFCTNLYSKLVTLETANKQARLEKVLAKIPSSFIIGRYRIGLEFSGQQWMWNNGNHLNYSNWNPNEPSSKTSCGGVTVTRDGRWHDNDNFCKNAIAQSVCEIRKL